MSKMFIRGCHEKVSGLNLIPRKTNQYGLTSDTVLQFNVVLPVSFPLWPTGKHNLVKSQAKSGIL